MKRTDLLKRLSSLALAFGALSSFAALTEIPLTSQMAGNVLLDRTIYTVPANSLVVIDARPMPGMSALRVPVGAETVIQIGTNSTLTVYGGPGYGIISGGAGIEVPVGAKLVICGEGKLISYGGSASAGGTGYGGREGLVSTYVTPDTLPDGALPCLRDQLPKGESLSGIDPKTFCNKPLQYCRAGSGGDGGEGGGGAGSGIGGRGGRGGDGGRGGVTRCVVPSALYNADGNAERYKLCEKFFMMDEFLPFYVSDLTSNYWITGPAGALGGTGLRGTSGGDVVIMEGVTVEAYAGSLSSYANAQGGSVGATATYGDDQVNTPLNLRTGFSGGSSVVSGVAGLIADPVVNGTFDKVMTALSYGGTAVGVVTTVIDMLGVFERAMLKKMHYYTGGGGGGGGAGGLAAPYGFGPGGPGGGGGGGGGGGLFMIGVGNIFEVGMFGKPELTRPRLPLSGHGGKGGRGGINGQDGSEVAHTKADSVPYNEIGGRIGAWSWLTKGVDVYAYGGDGATGGTTGPSNATKMVIMCAKADRIKGLPPSGVTAITGPVVSTIRFIDGQTSSDMDFVCGTILHTAPRTAPDTAGHYFGGYYTGQNGTGLQVFDAFCNPVGGGLLTSNMTLYAHWTQTQTDTRITNIVNVSTGVGIVNGQVLPSETIYNFTSDVTYANETNSPITLSAGRTVFNIPVNKTVTLTGGNALTATTGVSARPAYPGLRVPTNATLIVIGGGRLVAKGGEPTNGVNGQDGSASVTSGEQFTLGAGGKGGSGGSGGAPGVGGIGGVGGDNANTTAGNGGASKRSDYDSHTDGNAGTKGADGQPGEGMGSVYLLDGALYATRGGSHTFSVGNRGNYGKSSSYTYIPATGYGVSIYRSGGGGGGGGGGAGSRAAYAVGGGGGGAVGGGGGGSGRCPITDDRDPEDYEFLAVQIRGNGGTNGKGGLKESITSPIGPDATSRGGKAGEAGAGGAAGSDGQLYVSLQSSYNPGVEDREPVRAWGHPALRRDITFRYKDEIVGKVAAQIGMPLPFISTNCIRGVRGYVVSRACLIRGGTTNEWYGAGGRPTLETYPGFDNVTLDLEFEPDYAAMAQLPPHAGFRYSGTNNVAFIAASNLTCRLVAGDATNSTYQAVNAGRYTYRVKLADGYTIWNDLVTNEIRDVQWTITKASITNDWGVGKSTLKYDWTKTKDENFYALTNNPSEVLGFTLPKDASVTAEVVRDVAEGYYAVQLNVNGGTNYFDRTYQGSFLVEKPLNLAVSSHYPWSGKLDIDIQGKVNEGEATAGENDWTVSDYKKFISCYNTKDIYLTLPIGKNTADDDGFIDIKLGKLGDMIDASITKWHGTIDLANYADSIRAVQTNGVYTVATIDGLPIDWGITPLDTTAWSFTDKDGTWPRYAVDSSDDIFRLRCSNGMSTNSVSGDDGDTVLLSVGTNAPAGSWFVPRSVSGRPIKDGRIGWTPTAPGQYVLEHKTVNTAGAQTSYFRAYFDNAGQPAARTNIVASITRLTGQVYYYTTMADAVADLRYGDTLTVIDDVQTQMAKFPSGVKVQVAEDGVFRMPTSGDTTRDYYYVTNVVTATNAFYKEAVRVTGCQFGLNAAKVKPTYEETNEEPVFLFGYDADGVNRTLCLRISNLKDDLYYALNYTTNLHTWTVAKTWLGLSGTQYVTVPDEVVKVLEEKKGGEFKLTATDNPTPTYTTQATSTGEAEITGSDAAGDGQLMIPAEIAGKPITGIAKNAFEGRTDLVSVEVGVNVTNFGENAFASCSNLTSVTFADGTLPFVIGAGAFRNCTKLEPEFIIPANCAYLGENAFTDSGVTNLYIPATLKAGKLGGFGKGRVVYVEYGAALSDLVGLKLPCELKDGTRIECWKKYSYILKDDGTVSIDGCNHITDGVLNPPSVLDGMPVTEIADCAFTNHTEIGSVLLPDSVTQVGCSVFLGCTSLESVTFGTGLNEIGAMAFGSYTNRAEISSVTFHSDAPLVGGDLGLSTDAEIYVDASTSGWGTTWQGCTVIRRYRFKYAEDVGGLEITGVEEQISGALIIPEEIDGNRVVSIGDNAFANCGGMTSVTIPSTVKVIGPWAFYACRALAELDLGTLNPGLVIEKEAFNCCKLAGTVSLPEGTTSVGECAFATCYTKEIYLPSTLVYLGNYALPSYSLRKCWFAGKPPEVDGALDLSKECRIYVPSWAKDYWGDTWEGCDVFTY